MLFSRRQGHEGPPSTQFASTIVAMPDVQPLPHPGGDSLPPDNPVTDASGAEGAMPDVVTDIGGLPSEVPDPADGPTLSHIGRYALKRQLGAGGLGTVFEAWDPLLSRAVAVKTLQFDTDHKSRVALDGLFLNEARAAAGLNHRYIVTIHDAGLSPHGVYIAMERLYGRDLQRALADGWRPAVEQTVQLVRRVTEALAFAHARGVVHCDIKPANIFVQRREKPKVLDFGIARILNGTKLPALEGAVVGSPRYRAPEQLNGSGVDARTDLFSLGVVMYEMLTGRRAFDGDTLADINAAVLDSTPPPVHEVDASIPADLSAIVSRMMARNPADRYTCASELSADLRRWMHDHQMRQDLTAPVPMRALTPAPAPAARPRLSPRWLMLGGGALAAAAVGVALLGLPRTPSPQPDVAPPAPVVATMPAAAVAAPQPPAPEPAAAAAEATPVPEAPAARPDVVAAKPASPATTPAQRTRPDTTPRNARPAAEAPATERTTPAAPAAPAATGSVQFAVSPWGEVEVNGSPSGTTPPLTRLTLPEGTHTITLRNADFAPHTVQVQVGADKPVTLRHRFGS